MKNQILLLAIALMFVPAANAKESAAKVQAENNEAAQAAPDNTKKNLRDRHTHKTAQDQSNKTNDVESTRLVRKAIMQEKGLSIDAQNVKIVTKNGTMTLRGPVDSSAEKEKIENLAKEHAGSLKLVNELEIKATR